MFRSVIIRVSVGIVLMSLGCAAQTAANTQSRSTDNTQIQTLDNSLSPAATTAPQNTGSNQAPAASNTPAQNTGSNPAPAASGAPAQNTNAKPAANTTQKTQKTTKASKKSKKAPNPIANIDSKQPDKVLFDRAMDAMKHSKYDVARLSLQTLINTYPDSEYVARAKLAIGDSWYQEGGTAGMAQAESEYKDFITFFPNMPEAAEAQLKIANIHYREMEKADRDPTHAKRAEEEYRQLIMQFPDSQLVPQAKEHLLEVQEVLAQREYMIGHFYYMRESYPAAIARLKSVADTYPLYSDADQALFELGNAYEREIDLVRRSKLPETAKGALIKQYTDAAVASYGRIITRYPLEERAADAKKRLEAMKQPVPKATPEAIAQDKAEIASRGSMGKVDKVMENFKKGPNVTEATKVGEPTLVDPKQASAPEMVRAANASVVSSLTNLNGNNQVTVERVGNGATTPASSAVPRSDAPPAAGPATGTPPAGSTDSTAVPELQNDLQPAPAPDASGAPEKAPPQVNDAAASNSSASGTSPSGATASDGTQAQADQANPSTESTSKKKKKKILGVF
jgi:outer membrane protein assembly factor BamD